MKSKLLLLLFLIASGFVSAQDTIKTLIITEAYLGIPAQNYVEISNVGEEPIQLSNFEIGQSASNAFSGGSGPNLPDKMLQPDSSFFIARVRDYAVNLYYEEDITGWNIGPVATPLDILEVADIQSHASENGTNPTDIPYDPDLDSVSSFNPFSMWFGRYAVYLEQHFENGDSAVVDQVMGVFDTPTDDGLYLRNKSMGLETDAYDVAGFPYAGNDAILVRKFSVKEGNLEFVRGTSEDDSEWIALEDRSGESWRRQPWTFGNHGDYNLDANTLESDVIDVDFANKVLTVPWGIRRPDGIMENMKKKPGIYWSYIMSPVQEDSLYYGVRTGDKLEIVVCGNDADRDTFDIIVEAPKASDNFVVPMVNFSNEGIDVAPMSTGSLRYPGWPNVKHVESAMDTITGYGRFSNWGLPYALRVDTLLERLEKPEKASWEFITGDGAEGRPDIKDGDILRVTAEDNSEREYYLKVKEFEGSDNASLSAITWPDMADPELFEFFYGWKGDTIPNFRSNTRLYQLKLPLETEGIPATVAKTAQVNATVETKRATYLFGSREDRTTEYTVTAEDDTTQLTYIVEWQKEQLPDNIQPYYAEPFVSEIITRYYFSRHFLEICNPGNQELDLSNYMIVASGSTNPGDAISDEPGWNNRYRKYIPGRKWKSEAEWATDPHTVEPEEDAAVNPIVAPGDVFCLSDMSTSGWWGYGNTGWTAITHAGYTESDVNFPNVSPWFNPWNEELDDMPIAYTNWGENQYIFKILNDSVKSGLKPATDPDDFELIEAVGNPEGGQIFFGYGSMNQNFTSYKRKPEYVLPNDTLGGSFGDGPETTEWSWLNRSKPGSAGGWPQSWTLTPLLDWGSHYFIPSTDYMSTVTSSAYKVSPGYKLEDIKGLQTGVTVSAFTSRLIKANENQTLVVKSMADGSELGMDDQVAMNDTLLVTSADGENVTKYVLEVTEEGLSSNARLTSDLYTIDIEEEPKSAADGHAGTGYVSGYEYGTALRTVLNNIDVPAGARLTVVDTEGNIVPTRRLNYDTVYVDVTVNDNTILEVIAEDGMTTINYWLRPEASLDDAFLTSDYFNVVQSSRLIEYVPGGISVSNFVAKLVPSSGATMKVVDRGGYERTSSSVRRDDKVAVTSPSGEVTNTYFISFLNSNEEAENSYLAYVLSDRWMVDQVNKVISGATAQTLLSDFLGYITPSMGATVTVLDKNGDEKATGDLDDGDMLKVTSGDGMLSTTYTLDLILTSADAFDSGQIVLYPNPTDGKINISGLEAGGRIQVFNSMGAAIRDINVESSMESVSLDDQPAGMYMFLISDADKLVGRYKVMRR